MEHRSEHNSLLPDSVNLEAWDESDLSGLEYIL